MDRKSWLWRRKSSERSTGETESSGSMSSYSERFSDDQIYSNQTTLSPEVTSKAASNEEEANDVKTLTERLSNALLNISVKEDLVRQNAKVAEEAVSGWEKAENEVLTLRQQLDAAKQKNTVLEDQVSYLNGALKECMKQLQQAKEEQEQKVHENAANNSYGWESKGPPELERRIIELETQLQTAKADDAAASVSSDLHQRLENLERENSRLKVELQSRLEELEFRTIERDLSTQAAETASKQHLESIKKVAKIEAECRRLKAMARKTLSANDQRSLTTSSVYVESFTDSMSDSGERLHVVENDMHKLGGWEMNEGEPSHYDSWSEPNQFKNENADVKNQIVLSTEINMMDDFLEMERLAALPDTESVSSYLVVGIASNQTNVGQITNTMNAEVEAAVRKNAELIKNVEKMEKEKLELEMDLTEWQKQLEASQNRIKEAELEIVELRTQLALEEKSNEEAYEELEATQAKNDIAESKLRVAQNEAEELVSKICSLEEEIEKERALSAENLAKCGKLEDELLKMKHEAQLHQNTDTLHREDVDKELNLKQEKELALASTRFAECRKTIESLGMQLKSLATLEDFLADSDNTMELTSEVTQGPQNGGEQLRLHDNDLSLSKRDSESSASLNPTIANEKCRNSFGRFYPGSKSVRRTGSHCK